MANLPRMRISLILRASLMAAVLVAWMAAPALAEPTVLSTDPEAGAELHEPPGAVTVEFSEPLQSSSGMTVTDECDDEVSEGEARISGTAMNELSVVIGDAPHNGTYTVEYVATGVTGASTGSFTFFVHGGTNCDGSGGGGHHHGGGSTGGGGHGGHGGGGGGMHSGHGGGSGGGSHSGHNMSGMGGSHTMDEGHTMNGHTMSGHKMNGRHHMDDKGGHKMNHGNMNHGNGDKNPPVAAPPTIPVATDIPTGSTVVIALGLAVLMGLIGGWVLRVSTPS